jgi:NAD(P)-dependent dehydrogenase (short-subunit alcohol dehydrogenase family)
MSNSNKTVIITGAGQGIGKGIALAFAQEKYNVVVADIVQANLDLVTKEVEALGVQALGVICDVSKKADVDNLVAKTQEKFGQIDALVNNAGIYPFKPFLELTENDWDKVMDINTKGVFLLTQAVAKVMPEGGKIVDVSSIASVVAFAGLVHYCASKGAINAMIKAIAVELAAKKITVNAVAPGAINTPGADQSKMGEEAVKQMLMAIPLARSGEPKDIADAVVFLASEKASYITGQTLIVDGGWTLR